MNYLSEIIRQWKRIEKYGIQSIKSTLDSFGKISYKIKAAKREHGYLLNIG